jgi:hypothetical protein
VVFSLGYDKPNDVDNPFHISSSRSIDAAIETFVPLFMDVHNKGTLIYFFFLFLFFLLQVLDAPLVLVGIKFTDKPRTDTSIDQKLKQLQSIAKHTKYFEYPFFLFFLCFFFFSPFYLLF